MSIQTVACTLTSLVIVCSAISIGMLRMPIYSWQHNMLVPLQNESRNPIQAIIVLGYEVDHKLGEPSIPLKHRLLTAMSILCNSTPTPSVVMMSGGSSWSVDPLYPTEADIMADWFTFTISQHHECIEKKDFTMLRERKSTSTVTNAFNSLNALKQNITTDQSFHIKIVTNPFHQFRSLLTFKRVQYILEQEAISVGQPWPHFHFSVTGVTDDDKGEGVTQWDWWREIAGIGFYWSMGWIVFDST